MRALALGAATGLLTVLPAATPAHASGPCPDGSIVQHTFRHHHRVAAVLCVPETHGYGVVSLRAQGVYRDRRKLMGLTVTTIVDGERSTRNVNGRYRSQVRLTQGSGVHDYHVVMYDGRGHKIVDGTAADHV